jgi:hypothetical protein
MLCEEIFAVYSENQTENKYSLESYWELKQVVYAITISPQSTVYQTVVRGPPAVSKWFQKEKYCKIVSDTERLENTCLLVDLQQKKKGKAVPLHALEALGGRGGIAPTHSRPRQ